MEKSHPKIASHVYATACCPFQAEFARCRGGRGGVPRTFRTKGARTRGRRPERHPPAGARASRGCQWPRGSRQVRPGRPTGQQQQTDAEVEPCTSADGRGPSHPRLLATPGRPQHLSAMPAGRRRSPGANGTAQAHPGGRGSSPVAFASSMSSSRRCACKGRRRRGDGGTCELQHMHSGRTSLVAHVSSSTCAAAVRRAHSISLPLLLSLRAEMTDDDAPWSRHAPLSLSPVVAVACAMKRVT